MRLRGRRCPFSFRKSACAAMEKEDTYHAHRPMTPSRKQPRTNGASVAGLGQLSMVEHALCPLGSGQTAGERLVHECEYHYSDAAGHRQTAQVRVACPLGLSAHDEFYLWGLLALTFSQATPEAEFHATPHYCLRQLGVIDQHARRGGRQYQQFSAALERLSVVRYQNGAFFDPIRAEHRRVSFGLFSYSLPLDVESSRTWRIAWDPLFFEAIGAAGGHLRFDIDLYRELDPASRRLFLLLSKVFYRRNKAPAFELRQLAVQVLGFSSTVADRDLKAKVGRCVRKLTRCGIIRSAAPADVFLRRANRSVSVQLERGAHFRRRGDTKSRQTIESPLVEPMLEIGVDAAAIPRILRENSASVIRQWVDITLAAKERFGAPFFRRSPAAYFIDNLRHAAAGTRTPPDWWHDIRHAERRRREGSPKGRSTKQPAIPDAETDTGALVSSMRTQFEAAGQSAKLAQRNAERFCREYDKCEATDQTDSVARLLALLE